MLVIIQLNHRLPLPYIFLYGFLNPKNRKIQRKILHGFKIQKRANKFLKNIVLKMRIMMHLNNLLDLVHNLSTVVLNN